MITVNQRADDFVGVLLLAVKKFPAIIVAGILYTVAITIGTLLLVVHGIILLEDLGGYESLMAIHRLVWSDWWRTNIVFFVPTLVIFIVFFMMDFLAVLPIRLPNLPAHSI